MSSIYDYQNIDRTNVLGIGVSAVNMDLAVKILLEARSNKVNGYVCVTGAHGIIESQRDDDLKYIHNNSFLTLPDGEPTVWMGKEQGYQNMSRVYGPDLMLNILEASSYGCSDAKFTHFFYGATKSILDQIVLNISNYFPGIKIVGVYAPPYRDLNADEENELAKIVKDLKPDFFWVGLSTPKQEKFIASHSNNPDFGLMLGVGAAFPIHAGVQKDAPEWIKSSGFHWFYRLLQEPRRLWRRYLDIVPSFLWLAFLQIFGLKKFNYNGN